MTQAPVDQDVHKVVDEYVAHWNDRIGETHKVGVLRETHRDYPLFHRHITEDLSLNFNLALGDTNPLYRDDEYAKASVWQQLITQPMQILSVGSVTRLPDPPDAPWLPLHGGGRYVFERPLIPGDVIDATDVWHGITEHTKPDRPHRTFIMHGERQFTDQRGQLVASLFPNIFAVVPKSGTANQVPGDGGTERIRRRYSEAELREIYDHYDAENSGELRRGADPRFFEDVHEGDDIGTVLKGPLDISDQASWAAVTGALTGYADKWALIRHERDHSPRDPETGAYHFDMTWHFSDTVARALGQPYAIGYAVLLEASFAHAVVNWAGDHAFLRSLESRMPAPVFLGDLYRITGKVSRKFEEGGRGLVELELSDVNQDGVLCGTAKCVVQLPHAGRPSEVIDQVRPV